MTKRLSLVLLAALVLSVSAWSQSIAVSSPAADDEWRLGSTQVIRWQSSGIAGEVAIKLRSESGSVSNIKSSMADRGSFSWTIPAGLPPGRYQVRVQTVAEDPFVFGDSASFQLSAASGMHPDFQLRPLQPKPQFSKAEQPQFEIKKAPKLQVRELAYDYRTEHFHAWVKNTGNAPFVGHFRWQWITDCGANEANKDIPPSQSALLESPQGMCLRFPCTPPGGSCSMHACFTIEPVEMDGTRHEYSRLEGDFPSFEHSQFLMGDPRILVRFLHGQHWVDCSHEYVIGPDDAFDYDPATKMATFFVGIPVRNCGSEAGRKDHLASRKLHWSVFHSPSNTYAWPLQSVSNGTYYSGTPIAPGQGILVERALTLKVRSGIYMLHVYGGPGPANPQFCVISLRFADSLIH